MKTSVPTHTKNNMFVKVNEQNNREIITSREIIKILQNRILKMMYL